MGWITNEAQRAIILQGVAGKGWPGITLPDCGGLLRLWETMGWPIEPKAGMGCVSCGEGLVAWVGHYGNDVWGLFGVAEWSGETWRAWAQMPPDAVTLFNARDYGAEPKGGPIEPGQWIGWQDGRNGGCHLGLAVTVLPTGAALTVQLSEGGPPVPCIGQRWFRIRERDDACAFFWQRGQTRFKHYMVLMTMLYHKQKKLTGYVVRGPKQPAMPGKPQRAMPVDHAREVARAGDLVKMAQAAVRGAFQQFGRDSVEFRAADQTYRDAAAKLAAAEAAWQAELLE